MKMNNHRSRWIIGVVIVSMLFWWLSPGISFNGDQPFGHWFVRLLVWLLLLLLTRVCYLFFSIQFHPQALTDKESARFTALKQQMQQVIAQLVKRPWTQWWSIYHRPWYMVIGEPGVGKTTLLEQSGLSFRWRSVSHRQLQESKDCDWYLSEQAVFMDVSNGLSQVPAEANLRATAWGQFLTLLRHVRLFRPLNGILVVLTVGQLLESDVAKRKAAAERLRHTIDTIQQHSYSRVPVYVMIAKTDTLPGFDAFFSNIKANRKGQVFGVTFPQHVKAPYKDILDTYDDQYQQLITQLNASVLPNMPREKDIATNMEAFHFPRSVALLKAGLHDFLEQGLYYSSYFRKIYLRGFYCVATSNTVGRGGQVNKGTYFCDDLFQSVIFHEASLGSIGQRFTGMLNTIKRSMCIGVVVFAAVMLMVWLAAFSKGQLYVAQMNSDLSNYQNQQPAWQQQPYDAGVTSSTMGILYGMSYAKQTQYAHWWKYLGFPFPGNVNLAIGQLYQQQLQIGYRPFVINELHNGLQNVLNNPPQDASDAYQQLEYDQQVYNWLSAYLMFQYTQHMSSDHVERVLHGYWQSLYQNQPQTAQQFNQMLQDMLRSSQKPAQLDNDLIAQARQTLGDQPVPVQAYFTLKTEANYLQQPDLVVGGSGTPSIFAFKKSHQLPYFATLNGYQYSFSNQENPAIEQVSQEKWVLGQDEVVALTDQKLAQYRTQMQQDYWTEYTHDWQQMLDGTSIPANDNLDQVGKQLAILAKDNSPLAVYLQQVYVNTSVSALSKINSDATGIAALQPYAAMDQFYDNQWPQWQDNITQLARYVQNIDDASNPQLAAYQSAISLAAGQIDIVNQWQQQLPNVPEPVRGWLQQLLKNSVQAISKASQQYLAQQWNQQFSNSCKTSLDGHYPFNSLSSNDVSLADLQQYFGNQSAMVQFIQQKIAPLADTKDPLAWKEKQVDGVRMGLSHELLNNTNSILAIHQGYFATNQNTPALSLQVEPMVLSKNLAGVDIEYNNQSYGYQNGPLQVQSLTWPDQGQSGDVTLQFNDLNGATATSIYPGLWGVVRWLHSAQWSALSQGWYQLQFASSGYEASYQVKLNNVEQQLPAVLQPTPLKCEM